MMIELFYPPKPYELGNREPSYVHRIYDTDDFPKRPLEDKTTEAYKRRLERERARYRIAKL